MIKYTILLLNMLAVIFVRMFFAEDVNVKMNVPAKVKQGEEFTVTLTINKGSITGVGHMKQELPAGLGNATILEAKGADFKYLSEDNVVKFTWISLPADQEFTVSYKVSAKADAADGKVNIAGKFSYVLDNEKQTYLVPEAAIVIGNEVVAANTTPEPEKKDTTAVTPTVVAPETTATATPEIIAVNPTTPETTPTSVSPPATTAVATAKPDTTVSPSTAAAKTAAPITASRTIVGSPEAGMEFTVEINVKKDGMKGFARIQETLPMGLRAMSLDNKGGTFSFIDQKVKIIWDNLPADEEVKVSYRVSAADNTSGNMEITGSFSYVENDDPKKAEIPSTTISVKGKTALATNTTPEGQNTTSTTPSTTTATNEPATTTTQPAVATSTATSVPAPEDKVAYKIQICALSKIERGTSYFESKFSISNKVSMEFHEGWKKYIVGKYDQYKEARDYRETIRAKGVENPFVTAYNSGKRITVQEALMVSNQQWVR